MTLSSKQSLIQSDYKSDFVFLNLKVFHMGEKVSTCVKRWEETFSPTWTTWQLFLLIRWEPFPPRWKHCRQVETYQRKVTSTKNGKCRICATVEGSQSDKSFLRLSPYWFARIGCCWTAAQSPFWQLIRLEFQLPFCSVSQPDFHW